MPIRPTTSTHWRATTSTIVPRCRRRSARWRRFGTRTCDDRGVPGYRPGIAAVLASTMVTIVVLVSVLVVLGIALTIVGLRLVRATRTDPAALGPLEVMGERQWRRAGPAERSVVLASARANPQPHEALAGDDVVGGEVVGEEAAVSAAPWSPPASADEPVDLAPPVAAESSGAVDRARTAADRARTAADAAASGATRAARTRTTDPCARAATAAARAAAAGARTAARAGSRADPPTASAGADAITVPAPAEPGTTDPAARVLDRRAGVRGGRRGERANRAGPAELSWTSTAAIRLGTFEAWLPSTSTKCWSVSANGQRR